MDVWRITKYNPLFRDRHDVFLHDDWTSLADIGKTLKSHQGRPVSVEDYLFVEDLYLNAVATFMEALAIPALHVSQLTNVDRQRTIQRMQQEEEKYPELLSSKLFSRFPMLKDGQAISQEDLGPLCRLILREYIWCKLEAKHALFVHFGWDYYMYIGASQPCQYALERIRRTGLFVEPMDASPYNDT